MKLLFAGAMAAAVAIIAPQTSDAAVFAAHLEMINNGNGTYNLTYRLNEDANQGVTLNVKGPAPLNNVVYTETIASQTKGEHTITWDGETVANVPVPDGQYSWEVVASTNNTGSAAYVKTGDGTQREHTFYQPLGIDVDNTTTSPHFGKVYITNSGTSITAVAANGRITDDGLYILSNDLEDITGQGDNSYKGGVAWAAGSSPYRVHVAPDGDVFITDWSDSHSGVWIMDPNDPNAAFSELFDNATRASTGLTVNHGSISSVYVEGVGADRVMYALDEDFISSTGTAAQRGSVWAHAIGETETGYSAPPTVVYDDSANGSPIINFSGKVIKDPHPDREGSWWISQYRFTEATANPNVLHFNGESIDWKSSVDLPFWLDALALMGGIDISSDGNLLAAGGFQYVEVIDVSDLQTDDNSIIFDDPGANASHRDIAFDPADNFLVGSSTSESVLYYSKQGQNTFTTPNPVGSEIVVGSTSVNGWELY